LEQNDKKTSISFEGRLYAVPKIVVIDEVLTKLFQKNKTVQFFASHSHMVHYTQNRQNGKLKANKNSVSMLKERNMARH